MTPLFTVVTCSASYDVGATHIDEVDSNVWTLPLLSQFAK